VERDASLFWEWRVLDPEADTGLLDLDTHEGATAPGR
jgi:hypothetical protein